MNSKRTTIVFLAVLVLLVLALAIVITWPFLKPFAFAVILAVVFYPVHERVLRVTRQRRALGALADHAGSLASVRSACLHHRHAGGE